MKEDAAPNHRDSLMLPCATTNVATYVRVARGVIVRALNPPGDRNAEAHVVHIHDAPEATCWHAEDADARPDRPHTAALPLASVSDAAQLRRAQGRVRVRALPSGAPTACITCGFEAGQ
jgi:hypothetical protein